MLETVGFNFIYMFASLQEKAVVKGEIKTHLNVII